MIFECLLLEQKMLFLIFAPTYKKPYYQYIDSIFKVENIAKTKNYEKRLAGNFSISVALNFIIIVGVEFKTTINDERIHRNALFLFVFIELFFFFTFLVFVLFRWGSKELCQNIDKYNQFWIFQPNE